MPARISVNTTQVDATFSRIAKAFTPAKQKSVNEYAGSVALDSVESYYQQKGRNLWINPTLPTHGPGRIQTRWSDRVATGWGLVRATSAGVAIENRTIGLAHKVEGGTISAKRKRYLTIPLVPEAHGRRAKEYSESIAPLFRIKNCLAEADDSEQGFRPVYALKKSVTHKPWPGALPPESLYVTAFMEAAKQAYLDAL